ncbi:hypothetical protein [Lysobacter sp. F6437]|uniref:hypothetical protein n=1 Tax=Lysobacter sp. F6437 TaxID=3459296 RepID=UPI00403D98A0
MLIRASIVLLLVLNLGVALWWGLRPAPPAPPSQPPAPGVATLQLVEGGTAPAAATPPVASAGPEISQCASFGPFAATAAATQAQANLEPLVLQSRARREYSGTPRNWKVFLPPFESMEQTEAAAERVAAAGFRDHFVVRDGDDARSLALGLYGNAASARERVATLSAAGFKAEIAPVGAGPAEHWIDAGAAGGFDIEAARDRVGAERAEPIDCDGFAPVATADAR